MTNITETEQKLKNVYHYQSRDFFLTPAEHEFFEILLKIINNHYIFPQVHLASIVDEKVRNGQDWHEVQSERILSELGHLFSKAPPIIVKECSIMRKLKPM